MYNSFLKNVFLKYTYIQNMESYSTSPNILMPSKVFRYVNIFPTKNVYCSPLSIEILFWDISFRKTSFILLYEWIYSLE